MNCYSCCKKIKQVTKTVLTIVGTLIVFLGLVVGIFLIVKAIITKATAPEIVSIPDFVGTPQTFTTYQQIQFPYSTKARNSNIIQFSFGSSFSPGAGGTLFIYLPETVIPIPPSSLDFIPSVIAEEVPTFRAYQTNNELFINNPYKLHLNVLPSIFYFAFESL